MNENATSTGPENFAAGLERLREIVALLENSEVGLEDGVRLYREACACVKFCRKRLDEARILLEDESGALQEAENFLSANGDAGGVSAPARREGGRTAPRQESMLSGFSDEVLF